MSENMGQMGRLSGSTQPTFVKSLQETQETSETLDTALNANKVEASKEKLLLEAEENSAMGILMKTERIRRRLPAKTEKAKHAQKSVLIRKEDADGLAGEFSQRQGNREYHLDPHLLSQLVAEELGAGINENSTPDEVIAILRQRLVINGKIPDVAIVDKAFKFLLEVTHLQIGQAGADTKERLTNIYNKIVLAQALHFDSNSSEIQVAQKIIGAVDAVAEMTGETVTETLHHYRKVVHDEPPDLQSLRKFYEGKGYKYMVRELKGLRTYLGGNLKQENLDNREMAKLIQSVKQIQALEWVFKHSKKYRDPMIMYLKSHHVFAEAA